MFNARFFCAVFFAPHYFPEIGATPVSVGLRNRLLLGVGL
jgi:hypothetical protein